MSAVEVDQARLNQLLNSEKLLNSLWENKGAEGKPLFTDPKEALAFKRAAKVLVPQASIPEDIAEPLLAPIREQLEATNKTALDALERLAAREKADSDNRAENDLQSKIAKAQAKYHLNDEGVALVVARMKEYGSLDVEGATEWVLGNLHTPAPISGGSAMAPGAVDFWGMQNEAQEEDFRKLSLDPVKWAENKILEISKEFQAA